MIPAAFGVAAGVTFLVGLLIGVTVGYSAAVERKARQERVQQARVIRFRSQQERGVVGRP